MVMWKWEAEDLVDMKRIIKEYAEKGQIYKGMQIR